MQPDFLSDIELYCSNKVVSDKIEIDGEEHHHICDVMRHKVNHEIFVTDGKGCIYTAKIFEINKKNLFAKIISGKYHQQNFQNIIFCIPRLKSADRFEFALEKCVELGITNFIVFDSKRTVAKGEKVERWQKILTSAMKQSLRAWIPNVIYKKNVADIYQQDGVKIILDQHAEKTFSEFLTQHYKSSQINYYFLFGPEGGFADDELKIDNGELKIRLTGNRLRSETAIIAAATELSLNLIQ